MNLEAESQQKPSTVCALHLLDAPVSTTTRCTTKCQVFINSSVWCTQSNLDYQTSTAQLQNSYKQCNNAVKVFHNCTQLVSLCTNMTSHTRYTSLVFEHIKGCVLLSSDWFIVTYLYNVQFMRSINYECHVSLI